MKGCPQNKVLFQKHVVLVSSHYLWQLPCRQPTQCQQGQSAS